MKLIKALKILLTIQVLMYGWAIYILYSSSHDGEDDLAGLGALIPLAIFCLLGLINLVLFVIYFIKCINKKLLIDGLVVALVTIVVTFAACYSLVLGWALSGPD